MWRILLLAFVVAISAQGCGGKDAHAVDGNLELSWDANAPGENVTNYSVYRDDVFFEIVDPAPIVNGRILFVFREYPGVHCYRVQAHNAWGASAMSEQVCVSDVPSAPGGVQVRVQ